MAHCFWIGDLASAAIHNTETVKHRYSSWAWESCYINRMLVLTRRSILSTTWGEAMILRFTRQGTSGVSPVVCILFYLYNCFTCCLYPFLFYTTVSPVVCILFYLYNCFTCCVHPFLFIQLFHLLFASFSIYTTVSPVVCILFYL